MENVYHDASLFTRWVKGEISDAERQSLERHPDFYLFRHLLESVKQQQLPDQDIQSLWTRFAASRQLRKRTSGPQWLWWWVAGAAVATLALFTWVFLYTAASPASNIAATATGEQKTVQLPDGSTVRLNAVSSVEFVTKNWASERRVRLIGEAFFQVKKRPAPFIVETAGGSVFVLGTNFNVQYRCNAFRVACYTGLVQATTLTGNEQALRGGQKTVARDGQWQPLMAITDPWPAWMQGESRFGDAPVYEVLAELERQYNIAVQASGIEGRRFSGTFIHGDLPLALRMVCEPLGLQYEMDGRQVFIRRKDDLLTPASEITAPLHFQ